MPYSFQRDIDALRNELLQDLENQLPDVDRSQGSLVHIHCSALASALWGLYAKLEYLARQLFPDTAASAFLERHALQRGLSRADGETDAQLLARLLSVLRQPPAGGNRYDWSRWAKDVSKDHGYRVERCAEAWVLENARGLGTINVPIISDWLVDPGDYPAWANNTAYVEGDVVKDDSYSGEYRAYIAITTGTSSGTGVKDDTGVQWEDCQEYPSASLLAEVSAYLDGKRPIGIWDYQVFPVMKKYQDVSMTVEGSDLNLTSIADQVKAFMKTLTGGKALHKAQLIGIAVEAGADNASVAGPDTVPVTWGPSRYERIWPAQVTVTQ